jgi:hypothetical protein
MQLPRIERAVNENEIKSLAEKLKSKDTHVVIPLVTPSCAAGKLLLDQNESVDLSEYSNEIAIPYVGQETIDKYDEFYKAVLKGLETIPENKNFDLVDLVGPCLIIIEQRDETKVISVKMTNHQEEDKKVFKEFLRDILYAIKSDQLENFLRFERVKYRIIRITQEILKPLMFWILK